MAIDTEPQDQAEAEGEATADGLCRLDLPGRELSDGEDFADDDPGTA